MGLMESVGGAGLWAPPAGSSAGSVVIAGAGTYCVSSCVPSHGAQASLLSLPAFVDLCARFPMLILI